MQGQDILTFYFDDMIPENFTKIESLTGEFILFINNFEIQNMNLDTIRNNVHPRTVALANDYIEILNYSILSGEYFSTENFNLTLKDNITKLNKIDESLRNIIENMPPTAIKAEEEEINHFKDKFYETTNYLKTLLNTYSEFTKQQIDNLDLDLFERKENSFINAMELSNYLYTNKDKFKQGLLLLKLNLELSDIDHSLSVEAEQYHKLESIEKELEETDFSSFKIIKEILYEKCIFLAKKIHGRIDKDGNKKLYNRFYRGKFTNLVEETNFEYYKTFNELLNIQSKDEHHQIDEFVKKFNSRINDQDLNFKEVFFTVKQYRFNSKLSKLDEAIVKIKDGIQKNQNIRKFDKIAYETNLNYAINNKLSCFINMNDDEELKKAIVEINIIQDETGIKNYFPHYKIVKSILTQVKNILNSEIEQSQISNIELKIAGIGDYLNKFRDNLEWCKELKFQYYQLPFEECRFEQEIEEENRILFLASSFIFPVNYEKLNNQIDKNNQDYINYETKISFKKDILKEKKHILELTEKLDKSTRKEIEILGVFSALVLFSAGELKLFSLISNTYEILLHSLGLAYGLGLFVLLTWVISRDFVTFKPSTIHWIIMGIFLVTTLAICGFLMFNSEKTFQQKSIEMMKFKLDSTQIRYKIDSTNQKNMIRAIKK